MKKKFLVCFSLVLIGINSSCSSNLIMFKDKNYYSRSDQRKKLLIAPISFVKFNDTARAYFQYFAKKPPDDLENNILKCFNSDLVKLSTKYAKKKKVEVSIKQQPIQLTATDSLKYKNDKIFDKKKTRFIEIKIPNKEIVDSLQSAFDCSLFITDITIVQKPYAYAYVISTPFGIAAGSGSGYDFIVGGNYYLWNYDKEGLICAGEFKHTAHSYDFNNTTGIHDFTHDIVTSILDKTPFYSIKDDEENELERKRLENPGGPY